MKHSAKIVKNEMGVDQVMVSLGVHIITNIWVGRLKW